MKNKQKSLVSNKLLQKIKFIGMLMIALLVLEYILGMYANLFVEIPEGSNGWQFAVGSGIIMSHIILGTLLLLFSIALFIFSIRAKEKSWTVISILGLVSIFGSLAYGSAFLSKDSDIGSFLMAVGLGIAVLVYSAGLYLALVNKK
ncbi:MAG: hypothetical protein WCI30_09530 [Clostridia bacterium]